MRTQLTPVHENLMEHYEANGWTVLAVTGEVDICSSAEIRTRVLRLLDDDGHRHFVLDLNGVTFLDSMGLGMIVAITKHIRAHEGSLLLSCSDDQVLKIFKIGGLRSVYTFHDSVGEATRHAPRADGLAGWPNSTPERPDRITTAG